MLLFASSLIFAALGATPSSQNLLNTDVASLLTTTPRSCIFVESSQAGLGIVLDANELARIERSGAGQGTASQRRMDEIRSQRARSLLQGTSKNRNGLGCLINTEYRFAAEKHQVVDWVYLIFYVFKQGHGRVWSMQTGSYLKNYKYVTYGAHCSWCPAGVESLRTMEESVLLSATLYVR